MKTEAHIPADSESVGKRLCWMLAGNVAGLMGSFSFDLGAHTQGPAIWMMILGAVALQKGLQ